MSCVDHLNFLNGTCPDCGLEVDAYGNTEAQLEHCCFPDCGCDGARLCMMGEASELAADMNVEGMWQRRGAERTGRVSRTDKRRAETIGEARMRLLGQITKDRT